MKMKCHYYIIDFEMKLWYNIYDEKYIVNFGGIFLPLFIKDPDTLPKKFHLLPNRFFRPSLRSERF